MEWDNGGTPLYITGVILNKEEILENLEKNIVKLTSSDTKLYYNPLDLPEVKNWVGNDIYGNNAAGMTVSEQKQFTDTLKKNYIAFSIDFWDSNDWVKALEFLGTPSLFRLPWVKDIIAIYK